MDCHEIVANDIVEEYVLGRLDAEQRDAFEAHYFECQSCLERLEACLALKRGLAAPAMAHASQANGRRMRLWLWPAALAAAAGLAIVVVHSRSESPLEPTGGTGSAGQAGSQSASLQTLGRFTPPPYTAPMWRGGSTQADERLQAGMARYAGGDYGGAATLLRGAAQGMPEQPAAWFFLGIALLKTQAIDEGIACLERVVELGDTPYLEPAHFYSAKGLLLKGDARAATGHLRAAIALKGDRESKARELLRQVEQATRSAAGS